MKPWERGWSTEGTPAGAPQAATLPPWERKWTAGPSQAAPPPPPAAPEVEPATSGDLVAQAATLGLSDEIGSYLMSPFRAAKRGYEWSLLAPGKAYDEGLEERRAALEAARQKGGLAATAADVAGSLLIPLGKPAGTFLRSLGKSAAVGAGSGAAYGFGTGEGTDDRLARAAVGGSVGGAVGAALPVAGAVAKGALAKTPGMASRFSRAMLGEAIADEGLTGAQLADRIAEANAAGKTGVTVMDVATPRGRVAGLAEGVVNSPNAMQARLTSQLEQRQAGQYERVVGDLGDALGIGRKRAAQTMQEIAERKAAAAGPAFERAWTFDTASSPATLRSFMEVMATDAGPQAYQRAFKIARNEDPKALFPSLQQMFDRDGQLVKPPDARFLHYMKMGLDDLYSSAVRGESGIGQTTANSVRKVRDRFRNVLKAENPAYGKALDDFAGDTALQDAIEAGKSTVLKSPDDMAEAMRGMSASELESFRIGAASRLIEKLGNKKRGPTADFTSPLDDENFAQKLTLLMPDAAKAEEWAKRFGIEGAMSGTAAITGNSRTAARLALAEAMNGDEAVGAALADVVTGMPTSAGNMVMAALGKVSKPLANFVKRQRRNAMGEMLSRTDKVAEEFLRMMDRRPPPVGHQTPRLAAPAAIGLGQVLLPEKP